jgi:hypothetical protein
MGCSPQPESARYTVPQYRADAALRADRLAACADDPGTLGRSPDCVNAREAKRLEESHSLRDLPPVGLIPDRSREKPAQDRAAGKRTPLY